MCFYSFPSKCRSVSILQMSALRPCSLPVCACVCLWHWLSLKTLNYVSGRALPEPAVCVMWCYLEVRSLFLLWEHWTLPISQTDTFSFLLYSFSSVSHMVWLKWEFVQGGNSQRQTPPIKPTLISPRGERKVESLERSGFLGLGKACRSKWGLEIDWEGRWIDRTCQDPKNPPQKTQ